MSEHDPRLTWRSRHDPRSKNYAAADLIADEALALPEKKTWRPGPILDQGREGACTGFATAGDLGASPHRVTVNDALARTIYYRARQIDEWPGENYEGSSVLAAVKAATELGFYSSYRWAFSITDLRDAVLGLGPAIIGIPWPRNAYQPRPSGLLDISGPVVGGHAILVTGYHPRMRLWRESWTARFEVFRLRNSWGPGYGRRGDAFITADDLAHLLASNGEACIPLVRHTKAREN